MLNSSNNYFNNLTYYNTNYYSYNFINNYSYYYSNNFFINHSNYNTNNYSHYNTNNFINYYSKSIYNFCSTSIISSKNIFSSNYYTDEEIYEKIKSDILSSFPKDGEEILINATGNYTFQITSLKNELDILKGNKNNTNKLSVIDLKECGDILIDFYNLTSDNDLLILKYENFASDVNEKSIQYEVYDQSTCTKLNLSVCSSVTIDIYSL